MKKALSIIANFVIKFEVSNAKIDIYLDWPDSGGIPILLNNSCGFERFISSLAIRLALLDISQLPKANFIAIDEGWNGLFDVAAPEVLSVRHIANEIGRQLGAQAIFKEGNFTAKEMCADLTGLNEKSRTGLRNFSEGLSALLEEEKSGNGT